MMNFHRDSAPDNRSASSEHLEFFDGSIYRDQPVDTSEIFKKDLDIAVIDDRKLLRECFARSLTMIQSELKIHQFDLISDFISNVNEQRSSIDLALICVEWKKNRTSDYIKQISNVSNLFKNIRFIIVSDIDDLEDLTAVIECGARGYIPNSDHLLVALQAMYLVKAGGIYIPANVLARSSQLVREMSQNSQPRNDFDLTPRQLSVAEALRRGKANKLIAYELNMCESTVKVHIRSIMKKLKVRNRTEAAFIINKILEDAGSSNAFSNNKRYFD